MINEWIRHADQKISLLLAANALIGASVATLLTVSRNPNAKAQSFIFALFNESPAAVFCVLSAICVFFSIFCCLMCILPRLSIKIDGQSEVPFSPLYFMSLAQQNLKESASQTRLKAALGDDALSAHLIAQIAAASEVARRKYRWNIAAVWSLTAAISLVFLAFVGKWLIFK